MPSVLTPSLIEDTSMGQNDILALEANFTNWVNERAAGLKNIDPFLYYCVENYMKPFDLTDDEIQFGITDGGNDGGVDAIYFLVGKKLVRDDTDLDPKRTSKVRLVIMQVKQSGGFSPTEVIKLERFTDDLLDLSRPASAFSTKYNPQLLEVMRVFKEKYRTILGAFPSINADYYYITKGDEMTPNTNAKDEAAKVKTTVQKHLSKAEFNFHFDNLQVLSDHVKQRPPQEKTIVWSENPMPAREGIVGLVKLRDYYEFIQDEDGEIADHIFEANVRGFQQSTPVNDAILKTLRESVEPNFWLLNNGITIIAAKSQKAGHMALTLEDPQIVNGLQTSREIFTYFSKDKPEKEERSILVKVIETPDAVVQDAVINATNSQNRMPPGALRATNPIHHRIEDLLRQYDLFYDRRKGFYKDKGKSIKKIVSMTELLQAVVSILLQRPDDARGRPSDYVKDDDKYKQVFGEDKYPLPVYLSCIQMLRKVESFLDSMKDLERGIRIDVKFYITALLACRLTNEVEPSPQKLINVDVNTIKDTLIEDCYKRVWKLYEAMGANATIARGPDLNKRLRTYIRRSLSAKKA